MGHAARRWSARIVTGGWVSVNRIGLVADGVSGFSLFRLRGEMGSFGISWFGGSKGDGGGMDESFMPVLL